MPDLLGRGGGVASTIPDRIYRVRSDACPHNDAPARPFRAPVENRERGAGTPIMSLLTLLIAIPLAVLGHELAHAGMALATTRGKVLVVVGYGPGVSLNFGRLALRLSPLAASGCCVHR